MNKYEKQYMDLIADAFGDDGQLQRIYSSLKWYISAAEKYKVLYYTFSIIAIAAPCVNSVITILCNNAWLSVFSSLSSISVSLLSLFQCQKRWGLYRSTSEQLKNAIEYYLEQPDERKEEFLGIVSKIHMNENAAWLENICKKESKTKPN